MKTDRTFGVEIEMNGEFNKVNGKIDYIYPAGENLSRLILLQPGWKCIRDSSCGSEFVSPPLCDTSPVQMQIESILSSGFKPTFKTSGLHIHVGAQDLTRYNCLELAQFCRHYERAIYSFVHPSRMKDSYCKPFRLKNSDIVALYNPEIKLNNSDRYRGCNISAYDKHGTIEYRYSEGTINYTKIRALIDLFIKITNYVVQNKNNLRCKSPRKTKEKREFLLNLIGVLPENKKELLNTVY